MVKGRRHSVQVRVGLWRCFIQGFTYAHVRTVLVPPRFDCRIPSPFQTIVARWFRWLSCCGRGYARFVSFKVAAASQRVPFTLLFLGYNCDWLMWRRQFCCCCCCSVFFRSFSVVCVPRYVLIFPGDVLRGPWPRPAHSSYVYVCGSSLSVRLGELVRW